MISSLLIVLAAITISVGLRTYRHPLLFRLGTFGIMASSFLAGWLIGGSMALGIFCAASWLFLPWLEILTRIRRMRLPLERTLAPSRPPTRTAFPSLEEITAEIEAQGFAHVDDTGCSDQEGRQFYRVFNHEAKRIQASISLVEQAEFAFFYLTLTSRGEDGRVFVTWNYPFSYGLKAFPCLRVNRVGGLRSIENLLEIHEAFMRDERAGVLLDQSAEEILAAMQRDMQTQISHNLHIGLLKRDGKECIRYSKRGMVFLWLQFLRDFVRLS